MKKIVLVVSLLVSIGIVSAQEKLGIATYSIPAGWQLGEQSSTGVVIENKIKNGICQITVFTTVNTAVSTASDFTSYRDRMGMPNIMYSTTKGAITKNQVNEMLSYSCNGTGTINGVSFRNYFYSFSNGKQTYFVQLSASNNACVDTFNKFLASLLIDPVEEVVKTGVLKKANGKGTKKAAPSAAPAAPAPMM
jgi:hypothetical protein